ncbi:MAG: 1-deoxy-D-xylulose-5-phosphate synthase [Nitrospirae bacterium CG_4_10_14_0_8_um_filter_41_23]|nr:MAG: 1-deoxy-D-xylulose-5-phosphate synthase [Nitrospirae bacterium CG2_30_41_42]PIQ94311.1 MAG: 1-deoxy-D-xylulose-5-phosphate synthase [Nitrospirae bacterium CG11_big_fil_rev_8_21_14_0_20_41_14]PIV44184.1 MAG: 1-deoxy-D-xylulose-5-phosphate synthase [Nitrospirae bacterium CG02_land_8_20_14_3_00_41_53]PIW87311.1 MAG: 1-deoxy-D-xylulose-5-phosphate synthase [Nitrospirae bacterium CG_4_8_14_3_um_filter_41_47]PIY86796.1 MAG: 1-deoxy-D-xylulose-5-phosphate synthase [Nitrospirae bacterium CG_4_1
MYLKQINSPSDLKKLSIPELKELATKLREIIINRVSINGGHLASNLGVVELTISLHYVFNSPVDKIIWDVGHQSYSHKLLTGRYERFSTLRKYKGISGFPKREESEHDAFGTGHSSTSISAALGIIEGRNKNKEKFKVIAVIGDGAMTAGLALEGLNNAGHLKNDLIVILNDNEMFISPNVGALSAYLNRILTGEFYQKFKKETKSFLEGIPKLGDKAAKIAQKTEEMLKGFFLPGVIFEELGFNYVGPIDGHNIELLIGTLKRIKTASSPTLIHVITKKGKGYAFSEKNPSLFHGIGPFNLETGAPLNESGSTYSEVFGDALTELADRDDKIIAISAAMKEGTGLEHFAKKYPDRFYDVGIAEPHAVTFAAGLATQGLKPVVTIYSTFFQRAYDEIVHDVCLQNLPVVFAIDRAGIVGEDGPTHNGLFDLSYLRHIPNLVVMAPKDDIELRVMLDLALKHKGPIAIRYPRGKIQTSDIRHQTSDHFGIGEAEILKEGDDIALIAIGNTVYPALSAAERLEKDGIATMVVNARFVKPLDRNLIFSVATIVPRIITIEENVLQGGFGSAVLEFLNETDIHNVRIKRLGMPDGFIEQGQQNELRKKYGLDEEGIYLSAFSFFREPLYSH